MKTKYAASLVLLIGLITSGASAAPAPASAAPESTAASMSVPSPEQIIYTSALPSLTDLTNAAAAQGIAVEQVRSSALQLTLVYEYPNGVSKVVAYQVSPPVPVVSAPSPLPSFLSPPPATDHDDYYDSVHPRYAFPLLTFRFDFGAGHRSWRESQPHA